MVQQREKTHEGYKYGKIKLEDTQFWYINSVTGRQGEHNSAQGRGDDCEQQAVLDLHAALPGEE